MKGLRHCARCRRFVSLNPRDEALPPAVSEIEHPDDPRRSRYFCGPCNELLWREAEATDARAREARRAA
jgi:hypothetical protein